MQYKDQSVLSSLVRVVQFLDAHPTELGPVTQSASRENLDRVIANLRSHGVTQAESATLAHGETEKLRVGRERLRRNYVVPIAMIAQARLPRTPEFAHLRAPHPSLRGPSFITTVRAMAIAAERQAGLFTAEGLPPDFAAQMRSAADELERGAAARDQGYSNMLKASRSVDEDIREAKTAVKVVDSLVKGALVKHPELAAVWAQAKKVRPKPGVAVGGREVTPLVIDRDVESAEVVGVVGVEKAA
jgi:hypothetical protein